MKKALIITAAVLVAGFVTALVLYTIFAGIGNFVEWTTEYWDMAAWHKVWRCIFAAVYLAGGFLVMWGTGLDVNEYLNRREKEH